MADNTVQNAVRSMSVLMANMYYYISKEMVETYGDSAKEVLARAMMAFGQDRGRKIAEKVKAAGEELTIENLDKYYDMPIVEGWDPHRKYYADHKDNITDSCTFAEVWLERDWAEIGHIYCLVDTGIRLGYSDHIKFCPVKNILLGDSCCQSRTIYCENNKE